MTGTSESLLDRLRRPAPAAADWERLHAVYVPFVRGVLTQAPDLRADADDLVQEVLLVLVKELPRFERQRDGSFRAWLRQVTVNRVRTWRREKNRRPGPADAFLDQLADPTSELSRMWDADHDRHLFEKLFGIVRPEFEPNTWRAFEFMTLHGLPAAAVAERLGMTSAAVFQANSRIRRRLREEAAGLAD